MVDQVHFRYYLLEKILITGQGIQTERELCKYLLETHGPGRFFLRAWQKGYEGFWVYWLGQINVDGFVRDARVNKEMKELREDYRSAEGEEKEWVGELIDMEKEEQQKKESYYDNEGKRIKRKRKKRRGPVGIKTCTPGKLHSYE